MNVTCPCGSSFAVDEVSARRVRWCPFCARDLSAPVAEVDDGTDSYSFTPSMNDLPDSVNTPSASFWANLGAIRMPFPAASIAIGGRNRLALVGARRQAVVIDLKARAIAATVQHTSPVMAVAFSSHGHAALSGDQAGTLLHFDLRSKKTATFLSGHSAPVSAIAISLNQTVAVSGSEDGALQLWRLTNDTEPRLLIGNAAGSAITAVAFSDDGRFVLAGDHDGGVGIWCAVTGERRQAFRTAGGPVASVRCRDSVVSAVTAPPDGASPGHPEIRQWNVDTGKRLPEFGKFAKATCIPECAILDHAGRRMVVAGRSAKVPLIPSQAARKILATMAADVRDAASDFVGLFQGAANPAAGFLLKPNHTLEVWSLISGARLQAFPGVRGPITNIAVSPDNTRILAASADGTLQVFAMPEG